MASEKVNFSFKCPLCGGTTLELPEGYTDDSMASCGSCGSTMARWGDIKAAAAEQRGPQEKSTFKGWTSR